MPRAVVALLVVAACFDPPPPPGELIESHTEVFEIPAYPPPDLDLLLVVDDTPAIEPYQTHIASFVTDLVAQVRGITNGTMPNMHIAVTTTSSGGVLRTTPGMSAAYLADSLEFDGTRTTNYQGTVEDTLGSLLAVSATSAGANQPLASLTTALQSPNGFVRRNGYGAVIVISASDDASVQLDYVTQVKQAYHDPYSVIVSGIYPASSPRLDSFFQSFPNRASIVAIDSIDWSDAYAQLGQIIRIPLSGLRCQTKPADADPTTPGDQFDCHISWVVDELEHPMPGCATGAPRPCWAFVPNSQTCGFEDYVLFQVDGFPDPYHPEIRGECVVK